MCLSDDFSASGPAAARAVPVTTESPEWNPWAARSGASQPARQREATPEWDLWAARSGASQPARQRGAVLLSLHPASGCGGIGFEPRSNKSQKA